MSSTHPSQAIVPPGSRLRLFTFAAPARFYALMGALLPWLWGLTIVLVMAFWAGIGWAFNARMASMLARAIAPTGALFAFLALWTGAFWGRPTWGTYWVWDARLTTTLILLFLYLGYIALVNAIDDVRRGDQAGALLALVGSVNVPIIYFSVKWWNTLHQGATISFKQAPTMATTMLVAMLIMTFAFWAYSFATVFTRTRALVLEREAHTAWVDELAKGRMPS
jgi:heme exporter protein C